MFNFNFEALIKLTFCRKLCTDIFGLHNALAKYEL